MQANRSKESELSADRLREILTYDPETGIFRCRVQRGKLRIGDIPGDTSHPGGYRVMRLGFSRYLAHRLAWLYVYGVWPEGEIDHIDGNTDNNSIGNLRAATSQQNKWNRPTVRSDSKFGVRNIRPRGNGFRVRIFEGRKLVYNRQYKSLEMAIAVRDKQLAAFRGEFCPEIREGS